MTRVRPFSRRIRHLSPGLALAVVVLTLAACTAKPVLTTATTTAAAPTTPAATLIPAFGALPSAHLASPLAAELQKALDDTVAAGTPGVMAAVITPDGTWAGAAGVDGPAGRHARPGDVFPFASISKTFTAALIMRLVEQGSMRLDAPLGDYVKGLGIDTNAATVRQALAMRSGIPDTPDSVAADVAAHPSRVWTTPEIIAEFPKPNAKAGTTYQYSNPTYKMLAIAAASVTKTPLPDLIKRELLDPAGSPATLLMQSERTPTPQPWALTTEDRTAGTGKALPTIANATFSMSASGMAGDAPSVAAWAWQLFAGKVVDQQSLATMMTVTDVDGNGLGLDHQNELEGYDAYGHSGSKTGYGAILTVVPKSQAVVVVFVNTDDGTESAIRSQLVDILLG